MQEGQLHLPQQQLQRPAPQPARFSRSARVQPVSASIVAVRRCCVLRCQNDYIPPRSCFSASRSHRPWCGFRITHADESLGDWRGGRNFAFVLSAWLKYTVRFRTSHAASGLFSGLKDAGETNPPLDNYATTFPTTIHEKREARQSENAIVMRFEGETCSRKDMQPTALVAPRCKVFFNKSRTNFVQL